MGLLGIFDKKLYFYRGLILDPADMQRIKSKGMDVPFYNGRNRAHLVNSMNVLMEEAGYVDKISRKGMNPVQLDIEKYGFRQLPILIGQLLAGTYVGIYMSSNFRESAAYALGMINRPHVVGSNQRGYVFCIEMKQSEIFVGDGDKLFDPIPSKYFAYKYGKMNSHTFYLDTHIPAQRIVNVVDLGPVKDLNITYAQKLLEDAVTKYGK